MGAWLVTDSNEDKSGFRVEGLSVGRKLSWGTPGIREILARQARLVAESKPGR